MPNRTIPERVIDCISALQQLNRSLTATVIQRTIAAKPTDRLDTQLALATFVQINLELMHDELSQPLRTTTPHPPASKKL